MPRRMSCSMTVPAVLDRTKTVTRRHPDTWRTLKAGDRLTLIEKGMGLAKGERQVVLAEVEVVDVRVEPLSMIHMDEGGTAAEGLGHMTSMEFVRFWLDGHGFRRLKMGDGAVSQPVRRIEWRYLDAPDPRRRTSSPTGDTMNATHDEWPETDSEREERLKLTQGWADGYDMADLNKWVRMMEARKARAEGKATDPHLDA